MALRWTLDKVGVIARDARDAALVLAAIYGPDGRDETVADVAFDWEPAADLRGVRVGVIASELAAPPEHTSDAEQVRHRESMPIWQAAVAALGDAGATLSEVTLPDLPARAMYAVVNAEAGAAFDELVRSGDVDRLTDRTPGGRANQLRWSRFVPAVEYLRAQRIRRLLIDSMDALFESVDLFVSPAESDSVTITNFTGHPAITVNAGFADGQPVGLMLTARHFAEDTLVRAADVFQQRTAWHRQRPPAFGTA
jgi:Asp-tRNA(Asn)/Glu-tRNA(Gln) amidotransferase A subunit family amidase